MLTVLEEVMTSAGLMTTWLVPLVHGESEASNWYDQLARVLPSGRGADCRLLTCAGIAAESVASHEVSGSRYMGGMARSSSR
jgi:hypothetical protein